jgi:hypothetical protein
MYGFSVQIVNLENRNPTDLLELLMKGIYNEKPSPPSQCQVSNRQLTIDDNDGILYEAGKVSGLLILKARYNTHVLRPR